MARRQVVELICDRCGKTETQEPSQVASAQPGVPELVVGFLGDKHEYMDLCLRCRKACEGYFKSMTKQTEQAEQPEGTTAEPERKGLLGLGGRKSG